MEVKRQPMLEYSPFLKSPCKKKGLRKVFLQFIHAIGVGFFIVLPYAILYHESIDLFYPKLLRSNKRRVIKGAC